MNKVAAKATGAKDMSNSLLIDAIRQGDHLRIRALLEGGASVTDPGTSRVPPLFLAACRPDDAVFRLLLRHTASLDTPDYYGDTLLLAAIKTKMERNALTLMDAGCDLSHLSRGWGYSEGSALMWASCLGIASVANALVIHGADVNQMNRAGHTAFDWAVRGSQEQMVSLLHHRGGASGRFLARSYGHPEKWPPGVASPVHFACYIDAIIDLREVLRIGFGIDAIAERGCVIAGATPLIIASFYNRADQVEVLLEEGANLNTRDRRDKTAIMRAVEEGNRESAGLLRAAGATCSELYRFLLASQTGDQKTLKAMIKEGVDVNGRDDSTEHGGRSAVSWAAWFEQEDIVRMLAPLSSDEELDEALQIASLRHNRAIESLLAVQRGCNVRLR